MTASFPPITTIAAAREVQEQLRGQVREESLSSAPRLIAGVDVAFAENGTWTKAAIVVLRYANLFPIETAIAAIPTIFPYRSGYLSFREIPAILPAWQRLQHRPDVIFCDGQGLAHPRRFGLACHLGVVLNIPTVGVAKSRLIGKHKDLSRQKGSWVTLTHNNEVVGMVLRSRENVKPLYISVGHRVTLNNAHQLVTHCLTRFRLPEPTRQADKVSKYPLDWFREQGACD